MRTQTYNTFLFFSFLLFSISCFSQQKHHHDELPGNTTRYEGAAVYLFDTIAANRLNNRSIPIHPSILDCPPNIDFEEGSFNLWRLDTGFVRGVNGFDSIANQAFNSIHGPSPTGFNQVTVTATPPMPNRHEIIQNTGAPIPLDPYGLFPIYPPDGSNFCIKLGSDVDHPGQRWPAARAERASYLINVPAGVTNYSITYQYAVVFQDPGHVPQNQPRFTVKLFDPATATYVPCGFVEYVADSTIPGFLLSTSTNVDDVWYKSWTPVFINLANYAGRTLYLEFTTEDCAQGGHWGYAYVDVNGCQLAVTANNDCQTPPHTTMDGPPGFIQYNWWNADYSALLGNGQHLVLNPGLALNALVHLELIPNSGQSCRDTITTNVTKDTLLYDAAANQVICAGNATTIGTGVLLPNATFTWSPNYQINNVHQPTALVNPDTSMPYFLVVTDTLTQCKVFDTVEVIVHPTPQIQTQSVSMCAGAGAVVAVSGADAYIWNPANGVTSTSTGIYNLNPAATTTYTITGNNNQTGCSNDTSITVSVYPKPLANFIAPPSQCANNNIFNFVSNASINAGSITSTLWRFQENQIASGIVSSHAFPGPGTYNVKLIVTSDRGCKDSTSRTVELKPIPIVNVVSNGPLVFCAGNTVNLTATIQSSSPVSSIQWSNQSGNIIGANSNSLFVQQSGNYQVQITNAAGCEATSNISTIVSNPIPQGSINLPSQNYICEGQTTTLSCNSSAIQYQWYLNNVPIPGANQSSINAQTPGTYGLQITTAAGCSNFATGNIQLNLFQKPRVAFQFAERCERLPIQFDNNSDTSTSGAVLWQWNFGDGNYSNAYQPIHAFSNGNNYTVTLTATSLRCPNLTATSNQLIRISSNIPGIRYPTIDAIANNITPMQARNIGNQFLWRPTVGLSNPNIRDPYFRLNMPMEYKIKITTDRGCETVDTVMTRMQFAIDIQVPTAFTPNGDGHNDVLNVFLIGIGKLKFFRVFNRWGQLLFETRDPRQLWDGTFQGKKQPAETYVWTAQGEGTDGKTVIRRGQTILIR